VLACPTQARHFGDLGDPTSDVSLLVAARGGQALMPELGYQPVNRYLPPRQRPVQAVAYEDAPTTMDIRNPLLRWMDRVLTR
jgi:Fe-S-cluster-containing dehydrogenase component